MKRVLFFVALCAAFAAIAEPLSIEEAQARLQSKSAAAATQAADVRAENARLIRENAQLRGQVAELLKERDALAAKMQERDRAEKDKEAATARAADAAKKPGDLSGTLSMAEFEAKLTGMTEEDVRRFAVGGKIYTDGASTEIKYLRFIVYLTDLKPGYGCYYAVSIKDGKVISWHKPQ